jgi:hypothetical protein
MGETLTEQNDSNSSPSTPTPTTANTANTASIANTHANSANATGLGLTCMVADSHISKSITGTPVGMSASPSQGQAGLAPVTSHRPISLSPHSSLMPPQSSLDKKEACAIADKHGMSAGRSSSLSSPKGTTNIQTPTVFFGIDGNGTKTVSSPLPSSHYVPSSTSSDDTSASCMSCMTSISSVANTAHSHSHASNDSR